MRQKSILTTAFLLILIVFFYKNNQLLTEKTLNFSHKIQTIFITQKATFLQYLQSHFDQKKQIEILQKQIKELEPKASLSVAFASKLNHFLKEANLKTYHPQLHLVQVLGLERMQVPDRLWVDFPAFKKEKNYGLIYQGYTAGIIRQQEGRPLAILQSSKESLFSVFIGKEHIQGIAFGDGNNIEIRYIPNYEKPQIGDEVLTSGNDEIFYEGIKVGRITRIEKRDMYKIATVRPYANPKEVQFFYAVEVK